MYKNGCIAAIKDGYGKITKEIPVGPGQKKDIILPFNTEFSVFLRNKTSKRIGAEVLIDGKNVLSNAKVIILDRGDMYTVEGFEDGGRFLFLDVNSDESQELGRQIGFKENGLVEVRFYNMIERPWSWCQEVNTIYVRNDDQRYNWYKSKGNDAYTPTITRSYEQPQKLYRSDDESTIKCYTQTSTPTRQFYTSSAFNPTVSEGVVEEGSSHEQTYESSSRYTVGSLITSFQFKISGFNAKRKNTQFEHESFMICSHCGENVINANFCSFCGNELS